MPNILDFFKRGARGRDSDPPPPPDHPRKGPPASQFNPFGDDRNIGPCLRCGETAPRNPLMFCVTCLAFAADLARWAIEKRVELGRAHYEEGEEIDVNVIGWAYVYTAKFPRDQGPDPSSPTFPDTIVPKGSYWQPEGSRGDPPKGICSCHFYLWN